MTKELTQIEKDRQAYIDICGYFKAKLQFTKDEDGRKVVDCYGLHNKLLVDKYIEINGKPKD